MDTREFYTLKAAALLHDPPNKAWIVTGKVKGVGGHEEFARELAKEALSGTALEEAVKRLGDRRIKRADIFSSSVDRWLLNILIEGDPRKLKEDSVKLKNIFDPNREVSFTSPPDTREVREVARTLGSLLHEVEDEKITWHLLYTLYEALWVEKGLPASPADTRAPTHTVFDHTYATTTSLNWFMESEETPRGLLVMIDLAGVQKFIKRSRKLRDLWVSSYLVSAIAWRLAWEFVEELGPDILLIPTCRHNPFYYHSIIAMIKDKVDGKVLEKVKSLSRLMSGYDPDKDGYPRAPVIPATITLLLPSYEVLNRFDRFKGLRSAEDLEKHLRKEYREVWRRVYDEVSSISVEGKSLPKEIEEYASKLKDYSKYGFREIPPLHLRVSRVDVGDLANRIVESGEDLYLLYSLALKKIRCEESWKKTFRVDPLTEVDLTGWTEEAYEGKPIGYPKASRRGFDYCTVCGVVPAVIRVESEDVELYFSRGERLCPYCLLKRLASIEEALQNVLEILLGRKASEKLFKIHFPSLSDIASIEFREEIVKRLEMLEKREPKAEREVLEYLKKAISNTIRGRVFIEKEELAWKAQKDLIESLEKLEIEPSTRDLLKSFCVTDAESLYFGEEKFRIIWREALKKINSILTRFKTRIDPPRIYYALIKCDGDSIGKLISGEISEATNLELEDYIKGLLEGPAKEIVSYVIDGRVRDAVKKAEEKGIEKSRVDKLKAFIDRLIEEKEILVSVAYHVSLSRALMRASTRDLERIEKMKGIAVYAGGDDLLALAPVSQELDIIYETRRSFSLGSEALPGFEVLRSSSKSCYHIPCLVSVGRSYSIYEAHYMYPMYMVIEKSNGLLEHVAKDSKWIRGDISKRKDSCIVAYSPRGGEETALLSLNISSIEDLALSIKTLRSLLYDVESGKFSTSLIYDLKDRFEVIAKLAEAKQFEILGSVVEKVFRDNFSEGKKTDWSRYVKFLSKAMEWRRESLEKDPTDKPVFLGTEVVKALSIARSGLRGEL